MFESVRNRVVVNNVLPFGGFFGYLVFAYLPLLALGWRAFSADPVVAGDIVDFSARQLVLLLSSVGYSLIVAVSAVTLGLMAALAVWQLRGSIREYVMWALILGVPVTATMYALSWMVVFRFFSVAARALGSFPGSGWLTSWFVHTMVFLPFATFLIVLSLDVLEPDLIAAARIFEKDLRVFFAIILPLISPFLAAITSLIFIFVLADYTVPALFSVNVYAMEIFAQYSAAYSVESCLLLSIPMIAAVVAVVVLAQRYLRCVMQNINPAARTGTSRFHWPGWFARLQYLGMGLLGLDIALLFLSLIPSSLQTDLAAQWSAASPDFFFSLGTGLLASLASIPFGIAIAAVLNGKSRYLWMYWILLLLPIALPSPLIGIGLISFWNVPWILDMNLDVLLPVVAAMIRFIPLAGMIMLAHLRSITPSFFDAAAIFSGSRLKTWLGVSIPLLLPGMVVGSLMVFACTLGELGATLMVLPPGSSTLTIRIFNYLHYGASESVAGLALLLIGILLCTGGTLLWVLRNATSIFRIG